MASPGPETERRLAIARRVVGRLAARTELRASLLAGSAAQGTSDEHSDIDLLNYYRELPDQATFDASMRELRAEPMGAPSPADADGFTAFYRVDGVQVQTGAELVTSLEQRLDRIAAGDVDWITAKVATGLLEGKALKGEELIRDWRRRARYPEQLRRREVEANLGFFAIWALDRHLAARDAELFRRQMLLDGAFRVLAVLSAVNRLYFTTFQFKRGGEHVSRMTARPERLAERLDRVANAAPSDAAGELRTLVEETKAIVRAEMPDVDVDVPWRVGPS
jgi:hypothetical protein